MGIAHSQLLVGSQWLEVNAPCLLKVHASTKEGRLIGSPRPYDLDDDDEHYTRLVTLETNEFNNECGWHEIKYSPPPSPLGDSKVEDQQRRDRHRRREEVVLREVEQEYARREDLRVRLQLPHGA